jgi:hypothetical protein
MADIDSSAGREKDPAEAWIMNFIHEHPVISKLLSAAAPAAAAGMVMDIPGTHLDVTPAPYPAKK